MANRYKTCSRGTFEDFKKSNIWIDIQNELLDWLDDLHLLLEDPLSPERPSGFTDKELYRFAGNIETVRKALRIVDIIIDNFDNNEEV